MQFNKQEFLNFREDLKEALKGIEEKYNIKVCQSNISYTDLDFNMKLKVSKNEEGVDIEKEKFKRHCWEFGFKEEQYKAKFKMQGKEFELIGFNLKSPKNCCSIKDLNNDKQYKTSSNSVKHALSIAI